MWTHYSRPDWFNVFSKLARRHPGERIGETNTFSYSSLGSSRLVLLYSSTF